jgi:hypothetical protein
MSKKQFEYDYHITGGKGNHPAVQALLKKGYQHFHVRYFPQARSWGGCSARSTWKVVFYDNAKFKIHVDGYSLNDFLDNVNKALSVEALINLQD